MSQSDQNILRDGCANLERGMDSGKAANILPNNQAAYLENITVRGGFAVNRPGYRQVWLKYYTGNLTAKQIAYNALVNAFRSGKFQGSEFYDDGIGRGSMLAQVSGLLYHLQFQGSSLTIGDASVPSDPSPTVFSRVYFCQADKYMVIQDSQTKPVIFDGAHSRRSDVDNYEVPIGSGPMAYGNLRLWVAKGRKYVAGDLTNGPSGVLMFTENASVVIGGAFELPLLQGNITGMKFIAQTDTSLGQGELLVAAANAVYAANVSINRDEWTSLQNPLQSVALPNSGAEGHWGLVNVNSDVFFRSSQGLRSIIYARRDYGTWGNVPLSSELSRVENIETKSLLKYISGVQHDNRLLMQALPQPLRNNCYFTGITALDFDLISSLGGKQAPCYDGLWTDLDSYQIIKGRFNGIERTFAFCRSKTRFYISQLVNVFFKPAGPSIDDVTKPHPIVFTGGGGTDAAAVLQFSYSPPDWFSSPPHIYSYPYNGINYQIGDIIVIDNTGATYTQSLTFRVVHFIGIGGPNPTIFLEVIQPGCYTVPPTDLATNPVSTTGIGTGLTLNLGVKWYILNGLITNPGHGYTSAPTVVVMENGVDTNLHFTAVLEPELEIWEITNNEYFDYPLDADGVYSERRIKSIIETASFPFLNTKKVLSSSTSNAALAKELRGCRLHVDEVVGQVNFTLQYKADQNPCWVDWYSWAICAEHCGHPCTLTEAVLTDQLGFPLSDQDGQLLVVTQECADCDPVFYVEQYRPRMMVGIPPKADDDSSLMPANVGYQFQVRLQWEGHCRIKLIELYAFDMEEEVNPPIVITEAVCRKVTCAC